MTHLCGKGIWLAHAQDLQRAAEMITRIDGTHVIAKVGHGPYYFPEAARELEQRVRSLGHTPLAWIQLTRRLPEEARKAIVMAFDLGYEAVILFLGQNVGPSTSLENLTEALIDVEIPRDRLILASPPLSQLADPATLKALVPVCQGGWMPMCFAAWGSDATTLIDRAVYHTLGDLSLFWGKTPDISPIISPRYGLEGEDVLPERFIPWVEAISRHGVDFFSVYHAAATEKVLWPMLQAVNIPCLETGGRTPVTAEPHVDVETGLTSIPQPVYITASASDSVWGIISRHGMKREQFWAWNAHLWESRGLPRDPDYLQEGWRIRVK
ncbi:MAG: hypothetical protein JXC32_19710 [Anaerolineae bacterium]|nr:hypothetical protein [Anaerolineae bacterium]